MDNADYGVGQHMIVITKWEESISCGSKGGTLAHSLVMVFDPAAPEGEMMRRFCRDCDRISYVPLLGGFLICPSPCPRKIKKEKGA